MKKNLYLFITIGVLIVFTLTYFISVNKISYAFAYDENEVLYNNKIISVKNAAKKYAEQNTNLFKEKDTIYVTVNDLIENKFLVADNDEGDFLDPTSEVKKLNDLKIKITKNEDGTYKTKILK